MSYGRIPDEEDDRLHSAENEAPITGSNPAASAYVDSGFGGHFLLDDNVETYDNPLVVDLNPKQSKMLKLTSQQGEPIIPKPVSNPPKKGHFESKKQSVSALQS